MIQQKYIMSAFRSFGVYGIVLIIFATVVVILISLVSKKALSWSVGNRLAAGSFDGAYCGGVAEIKCPTGYICVKEYRLPGSDGTCVEQVTGKVKRK